MITKNARAVISSELRSEEQLLWCGQPQQRILWGKSDIVMIPFSLVWAGFIISRIYDTMIQEEAPGLFKFVAVSMILVILLALFGPFPVEAYRRRRTYYGVTNERIIIILEVRHRHVTCVNVKTLQEISFSERSDRKGTIVFGSIAPKYSWFERGDEKKNRASSPSFERIEHVRDVYNLVCEAQKDCQ